MAENDITSGLAKTSLSGSGDSSKREDGIISFANQNLKLNTSVDAEDIFEILNSAPSVVELSLSGNTIGIEAAKKIADGLLNHPEFTRAQWADIFTGRSKEEIPDALQHLGEGIMASGAHLAELNLSDNAFGPNGLVGLVDWLKTSCCVSLKTLKLNNNGLGTNGGRMLADSLLALHETSIKAGTPFALKTFISGRNRLEVKGSSALAEAFTKIGSLEEVRMPQNGITYKGVMALAAAFSKNVNLKVIDLNDNTFTEAGSKAMAEVLPGLLNLEEINFGDCLVQTEGAVAIAVSLAKHQNLRILNLSFGNIVLRGGLVVVDWMKDKDLETLELNGNHFGEDGVEKIRELVGDEILGSLSDDEGEESDEENPAGITDSEDSESEEDEVDDEQEEEIRTQTKQLGIQGVTVNDFMIFPSGSKLNSLGEESIDVIVSELTRLDVFEALRKFFYICTALKDGTNSELFFKIGDSFFSKLFGDDARANACVVNDVLVQMGLIKYEDKKFQPLPLSVGTLIVLEHCAKQTYFPHVARQILAVFLSKEDTLVWRNSDLIPVRNRLIQSLT